MLTTKANEAILIAEDGFVKKQDASNWQFRWAYFFKDPMNKLRDRPKVDVSMPYNPSDETHAARKHGMQMGALFPTSLAHFAGLYDEAPYVTSMSSWECCSIGWVMATLGAFEGYIFKASSAQFNIRNPRVSFAHRIVVGSRFARSQICWLIGVCGYFYSYELLYTYAPFFKIDDPSSNGWASPWKENQTTYGARAVAAVFPALAQVFWNGSLRGLCGMTLQWVGLSLWYEFCRCLFFPGQKGFITSKAAMEMEHLAQYGDLQPDMKHHVDGDSMRTDKATMYRFMRHGDGVLSELLQKASVHDERPMVRTLNLVPNPYFNWQKAKQGYEDKPYVVKNDMWEMPSVMGARMRSGAMDLHPAY